MIDMIGEAEAVEEVVTIGECIWRPSTDDERLPMVNAKRDKTKPFHMSHAQNAFRKEKEKQLEAGQCRKTRITICIVDFLPWN